MCTQKNPLPRLRLFWKGSITLSGFLWEYLKIISQRTEFSSAFLSIFLGCEDITLPKARCAGDYLDNQRFLFLFMV